MPAGRIPDGERKKKMAFTLQLYKDYHVFFKEIAHNCTGGDIGRMINEAIELWLRTNEGVLQGYMFNPKTRKLFKKFLENNDE